VDAINTAIKDVRRGAKWTFSTLEIGTKNKKFLENEVSSLIPIILT